jgi:hypothetical protein
MIATALVAAGVTAPVAVALTTAPKWPDAQLIRHIESKIIMPGGAKPLGQYLRVYAPSIGPAGKLVEGRFETSKAPGVKVVSPGQLPLVMDGGCSFVDLTYDVARDRIVRIACHGYA